MIDMPSVCTARIGDEASLAIAPMNLPGMLHVEEEHLARLMAPDRRREFTVGRIAAREALRAAGAPSIAVMIGDAGQPLWPENWVGSLSHTRAYAAALVAAVSRYRAVGIDLDDGRPLGAQATADLMTSDEVRLILESGIATDVEGAQRFVFSAKEAVYKCQYPLTRRTDLDFLDVTLTFARDAAGSNRLVASWAAAGVAPTELMLEVFPAEIQGLVLAVAVAPQSITSLRV